MLICALTSLTIFNKKLVTVFHSGGSFRNWDWGGGGGDSYVSLCGIAYTDRGRFDDLVYEDVI